MFPNVRWLFAAMLASIVVLSGGFGLFASLRVMHEPLTHLPPGAGPPQSFADNTDVPAAPAIVAPFQSRFPADSRPIIQVAADLQALRLDRGETSAPIEPPAAQQAVTADAAAQVQTAEIPDSAMALEFADGSPRKRRNSRHCNVRHRNVRHRDAEHRNVRDRIDRASARTRPGPSTPRRSCRCPRPPRPRHPRKPRLRARERLPRERLPSVQSTNASPPGRVAPDGRARTTAARQRQRRRSRRFPASRSRTTRSRARCRRLKIRGRSDAPAAAGRWVAPSCPQLPSIRIRSAAARD